MSTVLTHLSQDKLFNANVKLSNVFPLQVAFYIFLAFKIHWLFPQPTRLASSSLENISSFFVTHSLGQEWLGEPDY